MNPQNPLRPCYLCGRPTTAIQFNLGNACTHAHFKVGTVRALESWNNRGSPKGCLDVFMDDFGTLVLPADRMTHESFCSRYYFFKGYL